MLDYAIFAVTFVGSLVAAVIYLYPVRLKPYAIVSNVPVIAITNICSVSVTFTLWFAESWTSLFMVWCFHLFSMFIVVTFGTIHISCRCLDTSSKWEIMNYTSNASNGSMHASICTCSCRLDIHLSHVCFSIIKKIN